MADSTSSNWLDGLKSDQSADLAAGLFGFNPPLEETNLILLPVEWAATRLYGKGACHAPKAILKASHQLNFYDPGLGEMVVHGIAMSESHPEIQVLNQEASRLVTNIWEGSSKADQKEEWTKEVNKLSKQVNKMVYEQAKSYIAQNKFVGVVGGDHSSPYGLLKALAEKHKEFTILHIDAHFNLRKKYEGFTWSHRSIMYNVLKHIPQVKRICHVGVRDFCAQEKEFSDTDDRSIAYTARELFHKEISGDLKDVFTSLINSLSNEIYVSFDICGLDPFLCPSTGLPVPGGLRYCDAAYLLEEIALRGKKIIGFDLCEVSPGSEWDAQVGARVLYKLCSALLYSQFHSTTL